MRALTQLDIPFSPRKGFFGFRIFQKEKNKTLKCHTDGCQNPLHLG